MDNTSQNSKEEVLKIFIEYLTKRGHRKTPERFAILEEIYNKTEHFDIETLYISMKNKNYRVSRATLYNTVELLLDCKLIIKHQFDKNIAQYETGFAKGHIHDHLIDTDSGNVMEFSDPRLKEIIEETCKKYNFDLSHHALYIYGTEKK